MLEFALPGRVRTTILFNYNNSWGPSDRARAGVPRRGRTRDADGGSAAGGARAPGRGPVPSAVWGGERGLHNPLARCVWGAARAGGRTRRAFFMYVDAQVLLYTLILLCPLTLSMKIA